MPSMFRPPNDDEKERIKQRKEKNLTLEALILDQKKMAAYQKQHEKCEIVLSNIFNLLLLRNPRPTPEISLMHDSPEKDDVIRIAADTLMNRGAPIQENRLDDPQYLHALCLLLIKTMVVNYHLKHDKKYQKNLDEQNRKIQEFATRIEEMAEKTPDFAEKDLLRRYATFIRNNTALSIQGKDFQNEMNGLLNHMEPALLTELQQPSLDLIKDLDALSATFMKEMGPQIKEDTERTTSKLLKAFKLTGPEPGKSKAGKDKEAEQANLPPELSDNPYRNLLGLISNTPGALTVSISNNLGNGLGLLNSIRAPIVSSTANFDSWNPTKEDIAGIGQGLFHQDSATDFKNSLTKSSLPRPFETDPTKNIT